MSNITIYQPTLDQALELLAERTITIMARGREAVAEMCMTMAEAQTHITHNYRKKQRGSIQKQWADKIGVKPATFHKYARAGIEYLAAPEKRQLTLEEVLGEKKPQRQPKKASLGNAHKLTEDRLAELLMWEAFAMYLSTQMPDRHFDAVYNKFKRQYNP